jgi:hypothetical protein
VQLRFGAQQNLSVEGAVGHPRRVESAARTRKSDASATAVTQLQGRVVKWPFARANWLGASATQGVQVPLPAAHIFNYPSSNSPFARHSRLNQAGILLC